jgi:GT2 family glycosyltransferase
VSVGRAAARAGDEPGREVPAATGGVATSSVIGSEGASGGAVSGRTVSTGSIGSDAAGQPVSLSCVILTMGDRPAEVNRAIASVLAQDGAPVELVVVGNGADVTGLPEGVKAIRLPENVGVSAGRNAGVKACGGDVVLFLDDDGWYPDPGLAAYIAGRFAADPALAVISMRVVDPDGGPGARWHVPRLRAGDPGRSSVVTTFCGGACAIRRSAFLAAGGLPAGFFYAHEETDLAWRLMDLGYRLEYDAAARMCHHAMPNARHERFYRLDGRNRVLLARRNLPWPLAAAYLFDWLLLNAARERSPRALRPWLRGCTAVGRAEPGPRRPISLRTAWRMTRAGRPPVI